MTLTLEKTFPPVRLQCSPIIINNVPCSKIIEMIGAKAFRGYHNLAAVFNGHKEEEKHAGTEMSMKEVKKSNMNPFDVPLATKIGGPNLGAPLLAGPPALNLGPGHE